MNCAASLLLVTDAPGRERGERMLADAVERLHQLEQRWSRFLPESEVTRLNWGAGTTLPVSADTIRLVETMTRGWYATSGAFDPTLLGTLVELGYACSRGNSTLCTSLPAGTRACGRTDAIVVDPDRREITLPVGTAIDPGGVGKGLAADIVAGELIATGALGALVEIGGDLRVLGTAPDQSAWLISVDDATGRDDVVIALADGGAATSTTRLRTWGSGGDQRHHLLDPTTFAPSTTGTVSCTVVAGSAAWAEVFTKVAFALDPSEALLVFENRSLAASITTESGPPLTTTMWNQFRR
jgi:thiamine biosynthesis lipoprotein